MKKQKEKLLGKKIKKYHQLLFMMIPAFVFFIIFAYIPMYGVVLAFKDFRIMDGIMASPWVPFCYMLNKSEWVPVRYRSNSVGVCR